MKLHLIFTDSEVVLSKREYKSWREVQNDFFNYKASLGPWCPNEVIEYLIDDQSNMEPDASTQVQELLISEHFEMALRFKSDDNC